jgi:hypothetical protein
MNNTFDLKRFGWLLRKTLMERFVQTIGLTGLILSLILILYFICKSLIGFQPAQNISFIWGLAGGGCFLASYMFGYFASGANGSSYLTLPASPFEKWLSGVLISVILYPAIFLVFFHLMDISFVSLYHYSLDKTSPLYKIRYDAVYPFSLTGRIAGKVYGIFFFIAGVSLVGSLYFNKVSFIKTALALCLICLVAFGANWLMATVIFGNIDEAGPFHYVVVEVGKGKGEIDLPEKAFRVYSYFADYVFPLALWLVAYIRLREKEF